MTPDDVRAQLSRLASDRPPVHQAAWRWFLSQGPAAAPALAAGLEDEALGSIAHWRILLILRDLREPSALPAIVRAFRAAVARGDVVVLPGALEALAGFDDEDAWAALISALDLGDPDAVSHAAVLLAHKGGARAEQAISKLLARPEMRWRQAAVAALSRIDSESAREILARHRAIETDPDVLKVFGRIP